MTPSRGGEHPPMDDFDALDTAQNPPGEFHDVNSRYGAPGADDEVVRRPSTTRVPEPSEAATSEPASQENIAAINARLNGSGDGEGWPVFDNTGLMTEGRQTSTSRSQEIPAFEGFDRNVSKDAASASQSAEQAPQSGQAVVPGRAESAPTTKNPSAADSNEQSEALDPTIPRLDQADVAGLLAASFHMDGQGALLANKGFRETPEMQGLLDRYQLDRSDGEIRYVEKETDTVAFTVASRKDVASDFDVVFPDGMTQSYSGEDGQLIVEDSAENQDEIQHDEATEAADEGSVKIEASDSTDKESRRQARLDKYNKRASDADIAYNRFNTVAGKIKRDVLEWRYVLEGKRQNRVGRKASENAVGRLATAQAEGRPAGGSAESDLGAANGQFESTEQSNARPNEAAWLSKEARHQHAEDRYNNQLRNVAAMRSMALGENASKSDVDAYIGMLENGSDPALLSFELNELRLADKNDSILTKEFRKKMRRRVRELSADMTTLELRAEKKMLSKLRRKEHKLIAKDLNEGRGRFETKARVPALAVFNTVNGVVGAEVQDVNERMGDHGDITFERSRLQKWRGERTKFRDLDWFTSTKEAFTASPLGTMRGRVALSGLIVAAGVAYQSKDFSVVSEFANDAWDTLNRFDAGSATAELIADAPNMAVELGESAATEAADAVEQTDQPPTGPITVVEAAASEAAGLDDLISAANEATPTISEGLANTSEILEEASNHFGDRVQDLSQLAENPQQGVFVEITSGQGTMSFLKDGLGASESLYDILGFEAADNFAREMNEIFSDQGVAEKGNIDSFIKFGPGQNKYPDISDPRFVDLLERAGRAVDSAQSLQQLQNIPGAP